MAVSQSPNYYFIRKNINGYIPVEKPVSSLCPGKIMNNLSKNSYELTIPFDSDKQPPNSGSSGDFPWNQKTL